VLGARHRVGADFHSLLGVDADDHASRSIDFAIDPNLPLVVDIRLEKQPGIG
jgi:hypothetical protein